MPKVNEIVNNIKDIDDAKETITNLLEIIEDMKEGKSELNTSEATTYYQSTNIGFVQ